MDKIIVLVMIVKERPKKNGRKPKLFADDILPLLGKGNSIAEVAKELNVSRVAIYNCLHRENVSIEL